MLAKKVTALLVSAALVLALLAGCGGGQQSVARTLLNLLDGKYTNVSVEMDSELEADLRQAVRGAETEAEIRAALENILGPGISFQLLGDGQKGDTAWNLILYPGSDPDAAGRAGFVEWNKVFSALPKDGQYTAQVAMIETDNGYALLVQATVDRAGSRDDDNDEPASVTSIEATGLTKTQYNKGESFDPTGMVVTVHYSDGSTKKIENIISNGNQGVTWSPVNINDNPTTVIVTYGGKTATVEVKLITLDRIEVTGPVKTYNTGDTFDKNDITVTAHYSNGTHTEVNNYTFTITKGDGTSISPSNSFDTAGTYTLTVEYNGITSNPITINVTEDLGYTESGNSYTVNSSEGLQNLFDKASETDNFADKTITLKAGQTYTVDTTNGPLAETFKGTLKGESAASKAQITLSGGASLFGTIADGGEVSYLDITMSGTIQGNGTTSVGAVAGYNEGTITGCDVNLTGNSIETNTFSFAYAGGIVGINENEITDCTVTGGTISAEGYIAYAGGIAGYNKDGTIEGSCKVDGTSVSATSTGGACAGGLVGSNSADSGSAEVTGSYNGSGTISAKSTSSIANAGGLVGNNIDSAEVTGSYNGSGAITATTESIDSFFAANAGGLVGYNIGGTVSAIYKGSSQIEAKAAKIVGGYAIASVPRNDLTNPNTDTNGSAFAGTGIGYDETEDRPIAATELPWPNT